MSLSLGNEGEQSILHAKMLENRTKKAPNFT